MAGNFVKIRRGVLQHLHENRLTFSEFGVFQLLLLLADAATGVVWTDSQKIACYFNDSVSQRAVKDALHGLKEKGYIKSFQQQGSRGSYPILINKYEITVGDLKGCLTNSEQTVDWRKPVVSDRTDEVSGGAPDEVSDGAPPYSRTVDLKTERAGEDNSTVQSGTAAHSVSPEEQKNTETTRTDQTILIEKYLQVKADWRDNYGDVPFEPADIYGLLEKYTQEDISGVMAWLNFIHKGNGQFNWMSKINNMADFARCFKGMFPQYQKCGGYKVAMIAKVKFDLDLEEERKRNTYFCLDCTATWLKGTPERHKPTCPRYVADREVFAVDDVKDTDGLVEEIPYK